MTATIITLRPHECRSKLWTSSGWIVTSDCHFGQPLPIDPPARNGRVA